MFLYSSLCASSMVVMIVSSVSYIKLPDIVHNLALALLINSNRGQYLSPVFFPVNGH